MSFSQAIAITNSIALILFGLWGLLKYLSLHIKIQPYTEDEEIMDEIDYSDGRCDDCYYRMELEKIEKQRADKKEVNNET